MEVGHVTQKKSGGEIHLQLPEAELEICIRRGAA